MHAKRGRKTACSTFVTTKLLKIKRTLFLPIHFAPPIPVCPNALHLCKCINILMGDICTLLTVQRPFPFLFPLRQLSFVSLNQFLTSLYYPLQRVVRLHRLLRSSRRLTIFNTLHWLFLLDSDVPILLFFSFHNDSYNVSSPKIKAAKIF